MRMEKLLMAFGLILGLGLLAGPASAIVVTGLSGGTVYPMPEVNYFGPGPQYFGGGSITWTSTNDINQGGSVFGYAGVYGSYSFFDNGSWDGGLGPMAGLNDYSDAYGGAIDTMTFTFSSPVNAVGGFMNYAPGGSTPTTIAVYDTNNNLIESFNLKFLTAGGTNSGQFLGFWEPSNTIAYFTLTDNYISITDFTVGGNPVTAPLPPTLLMAGPALLSLVVLGRRSRNNSGRIGIGWRRFRQS